MPSTESAALKKHFQSMTDRMTANPTMDLLTLRTMLEELHERAAEPTGVTYEEVQAGGRPALWASPIGGAADRVIVYFHGGGFVTGSMDSHRKLAGHLAKATGCRALVPHFRLAPENPFPAQLEDAVAVYRWLLDADIKPGHIATAGDSAGGNLATSVVLKLRQDGVALPAAIVAFSPWYDMESSGKSMDTNAATDAFVSRAVSQNMAAMFLGGHSAKDPLANPLYADPTGLPPMYVTFGTHETLQDCAERFAATAKKAGVDITVEHSEGMQHVYPFMAGRAPEANRTIASVGRWLRPRLGLKEL